VAQHCNGCNPHIDWRKAAPPGWEDEAELYKGIEVYTAKGFDAMVSGILLGFEACFGVMIGNNFTPDNEGWIPDYTNGGGGHAMTGVGIRRRGNKWGILTANSWGTNWGQDGYCVVPESYFRTYWEEAWLLRTVVHEDSPLPEPGNE
jgi:hypothetical protein